MKWTTTFCLNIQWYLKKDEINKQLENNRCLCFIPSFFRLVVRSKVSASSHLMLERSCSLRSSKILPQTSSSLNRLKTFAMNGDGDELVWKWFWPSYSLTFAYAQTKSCRGRSERCGWNPNGDKHHLWRMSRPRHLRNCHSFHPLEKTDAKNISEKAIKRTECPKSLRV